MFIPVLGHRSSGTKALLPKSKADSPPEWNKKVSRELRSKTTLPPHQSQSACTCAAEVIGRGCSKGAEDAGSPL
jgi:hypothetical protein